MKQATLEQIRSAGLDALRPELGTTDATRFLRLFQHGKGDYSGRRRRLFRGKSVSTIAQEIRARRSDK